MTDPLTQSLPETIWLQVDPEGDPEDRSEALQRESWDDLTWCWDSIGGQEVRYVRADVVDRLRAEVEAKNARIAELEARALPDGWVAVPAEPTPEMRDTFRADPGSVTYFSHTTIRCEDFRGRYRAMLSARPELPKDSDHE